MDKIKSTIDPIEFFTQFVSPRKPVILESFPTDFPKEFNLDFILSHDPNCKIKAESKLNGNFGSNNPRIEMSFSEFVKDHLKSGNYYLTTQYKESDASTSTSNNEECSIQEFCQPPLTNLISYFPSRPKLLGNLIPQQVNIWVGCTLNGHTTSSGLHHDFHDNLYLVLSGEKQFTLFPPQEAPNLYTFGDIIRIWPNGFIQYEPRMRSDGAYLYNVAEWKLCMAERDLQECEEQGLDTKEAEDKIERAMDECLLYQQEEEEDDDEQEPDLLSLESYSDDNDKEQVYESSKKRKHNTSLKEDQDENKKSHSEPNSFSKIDPKSLHSRDFSSFPLAATLKPIQFTLKKGEALYLPAGWFHEVVSVGTGDSDGIHTAFNYWMCPPSTAKFENPYEDEYWKCQWNELEM